MPPLPSIPQSISSLEYTHVVTDHYVYLHRWVALCGHLHGKPVSQLKDMEYDIFEQLAADLEDDPENSVMRAALGNFFCWIDLMDTLDQEVQLCPSLCYWRGIRRLFSEIAVVTHRVELYTGSVRALQTRQWLLDREVAIVDQAFRSTAAVGAHYSDLEERLGARLRALELLLPF
ncbi:hypothetical protein LIER_12118 [Lithospermum erythrorhizon]|uniref:Uncharacterized protein n=1 Tax=Lithospermum erythrorhizon TaxID=34254 RepID=A0AAV3PQN2_LITER